jgi:hypothetical protein
MASVDLNSLLALLTVFPLDTLPAAVSALTVAELQAIAIYHVCAKNASAPAVPTGLSQLLSLDVYLLTVTRCQRVTATHPSQ